MYDMDTFAEDKELEFKLFIEEHKIDYLDDVLVYDEKVSNVDVFVNQRSRWIAFQLIYASKYFFKSFYELFVKFNFDFFDKVYQQLLPPRILLLGLSFILTIIAIFFSSEFMAFAWIAEFAICIIALLFAIPRNFYNIRTLMAIFNLPLGFVLMLTSLSRFRKAQKRFGPTPHILTSKNEKEKKI